MSFQATRGIKTPEDQRESLHDLIDAHRPENKYRNAHLFSAIAEVGIAEDLYLAVLKSLRNLWFKIQELEVGQKTIKSRRHVKTQLEILLLWGEGFRNGKLDRALNMSKFLKAEVLTLLSSIARLLLQTVKYLPTQDTSAESSETLCETLKKAEENTIDETSENGWSITGSDDSSTENSSASSDDSNCLTSSNKDSPTWMRRFSKNLTCYIESLTDLAFSIDQALDHRNLDKTKTLLPQNQSISKYSQVGSTPIDVCHGSVEISSKTPATLITLTSKEQRRRRTRPLISCAMCKKRRIRCDRGLPACRNCTRQTVKCEYRIPPKGADGGSSTKVKRGFLVERTVNAVTARPTSKAEDKTTKGISHISVVSTLITRSINPATTVSCLPRNQRKLLYHMSSLAMSIDAHRTNDMVIYLKQLPKLLTVAFSYDFVMHGLMSWAACHMAFSTGSQAAHDVARHLKILSMKGLQKNINSFCKENSDAVLSASLLLSWQAGDPREFETLNNGTSAVISALTPWLKSSLFSSYIDDYHYYTTATNIVQQPVNELPRFSSDTASTLQYVYSALKGAAAYANGRTIELSLIHGLMAFVQTVEGHIPITEPAMRFYIFEPIRNMLYWSPIQLHADALSDPIKMVVLAYLYAIALVLQPAFASPGAVHFQSLSTVSIEEIYKRLLERHNRSDKLKRREKTKMDTFIPLRLMDFPMQCVAVFKLKIGLSVNMPIIIDQSLNNIYF